MFILQYTLIKSQLHYTNESQFIIETTKKEVKTNSSCIRIQLILRYLLGEEDAVPRNVISGYSSDANL